MNKKMLSLSVCLALFAFNAQAGVVIEDGSHSSAQSSTQTSRATGFSWRSASSSDRVSGPTSAAVITSSASASTPVSSVVTSSGRRPAHIPTAGWAKDLPLNLALRQVVPENFSIQENGVALTKNVSWSGDRPWNDVLAVLAVEGSFLAHIDWEKREVSLAPNLLSKTEPAIVNLQPVSNEPRLAPAIASGAMVIKERSTEPFVAAQRPIAPAQVWSLNPSLTLRENVEEWGRKSGWRVVWEGADYPIEASANFTGSLDSPEGPIARLMTAYEKSDQPLAAELTTMDRVIHIRNKNYQKVLVPPTSPIAIGNSQN